MTAAERRIVGGLALAWAFGVVAGWLDAPARLIRIADGSRQRPLPSVEALTRRYGADHLRTRLYAAGLALRERRERSSGPPRPLDPDTADIAAWDRLPGIGPRGAAAIVAYRERRGGLRGEADLLDVPGIGPKTLEKVRPYLRWKGGSDALTAPRRPDLNVVDAAYLQKLDGIGPKLANSLIDERRRRGGYRDWEEVRAVAGIGPAKLETLKSATRLSP